MPELPEVETIRRSLEPVLVAHRIDRVIASPVRLREAIEPARWTRSLLGARLLGLTRRGKYLLADFGQTVAVFHLGMSGRLMLSAPGRNPLPHTHLRLRFDHGVELRLVDPRRFGVAVILDRRRLASYEPLLRLGPDALAAHATAALVEAAGRSRAPIRNLLLDQSVVAGLGNIYATEALARAGIDPLRAARGISRRRILRLAGSVRVVIGEALAAGGTTLADGGFIDAMGRNGYFAVRLQVYGREGEACPRCSSAIVRRALAGRSVFFCPRCQR